MKQPCSRNATYRSKTIQNEIIDCCGDVITEQIVEEIKESKFFSIMADEAQGCANKEQMPLVIRYVEQGEIRETFIKFILCNSGLTGLALSEKIKQAIDDLGLEMKDCRGQCYDGAGNMAGKCAGAAARIREEYNFAIYTHCTSHRLNLCVAASCKLQLIKNMMENVRVISDFFNNPPKRQQLLEEMVVEHLPQSSHEKLIDVCRTRWVLRLDGLERFQEMIVLITEALLTIKYNEDGFWDSSSAAASGLFDICQDFTFIIALIIARHCLAFTRPATVKLLYTDMDITAAFKEISLLTASLSNVRKNINYHHTEWYTEACDIASQVDATVKKPRINSRQTLRSNTPAETVEDYFRLNLSVPFIDHLLNELRTRFFEMNYTAVKGFSVIPSFMMRNRDPAFIVGSLGSNFYPTISHPSTQNKTGGSRDLLASNFRPTGNQEKNKVQETNDVLVKVASNQMITVNPPCDTDQKMNSVEPTSSSTEKLISQSSWKSDFLEFCQQYENDFPNIRMLSSELAMWETFWTETFGKELPNSIAKTLRLTDSQSHFQISM